MWSLFIASGVSSVNEEGVEKCEKASGRSSYSPDKLARVDEAGAPCGRRALSFMAASATPWASRRRMTALIGNRGSIAHSLSKPRRRHHDARLRPVSNGLAYLNALRPSSSSQWNRRRHRAHACGHSTKLSVISYSSWSFLKPQYKIAGHWAY